MVFGAFDILHKGHEFFLKEAKKYGDELIVVVGLDETIQFLKKRKPYNSQNSRIENLKKLNIVDKVFSGNKKDKFKVIEDIKPDILVFGYDQESFNSNIQEELEKRNLEQIKIKNINTSFFPEQYKSSIIREKLKKDLR